jgi:hypothetical protein
MIRYFNDYSRGKLDLTGTQVFGWFKLDKSVQQYNDLGQGARPELIKWARAAAAAEDIDLNPFRVRNCSSGNRFRNGCLLVPASWSGR